MQTFFSAGAPQLPGFAQVKTYAAHRVWKFSYDHEDVKFMPLPKRDAVKIFYNLMRFERQTSRTRVDAFGRRTTQGKIGRMGLLVAHAMLFEFLNYKSGRLDPSYQAIAEKAIVSVRSVARAIVKLRDAGVLNWIRRRSGAMIDGRYILEQGSNAYGVTPPSHWHGFWAPPDPPRPAAGTWGDHPPMPGVLALAAAELAAGGTKAAQAHLDSDPGDGLAAALGRLRRMPGRDA